MTKPWREMYQLTAPHFCAGLIVERVNNVTRVAEAAPILKWTIGKRWTDVVSYIKRKNWKVTAITIGEGEEL